MKKIMYITFYTIVIIDFIIAIGLIFHLQRENRLNTKIEVITDGEVTTYNAEEFIEYKKAGN